MASEFAKTLSDKLTADIPQEVVVWGQRIIDAELQEIRNVLDALRKGECWCVTRLEYSLIAAGPIARDDNDHDSHCVRTRSLYQRLSEGVGKCR